MSILPDGKAPVTPTLDCTNGMQTAKNPTSFNDPHMSRAVLLAGLLAAQGCIDVNPYIEEDLNRLAIKTIYEWLRILYPIPDDLNPDFRGLNHGLRFGGEG